MITVKLLGGLGNQLWQRAFGLALEARGYEVQFDKSSLVEGTHREYSLGYFGVTAIISTQDVARVYENGLRFNSDYLSPRDPSMMIGYWQSPKYLENITDKVRKTFTFKGVPVRYVNTIAVHVRRQDYVGLQHFHGMPSLEYYREAVAHIRRQTGYNCPVIVFSDDPQWCFENFPSDFQIANGN